ncbi:MAG TPA: LacI family transcriptional regulator, partial [Firmicutes bacterium]|nr:LacI family transcriptional regulator [Bacillota bacterium]
MATINDVAKKAGVSKTTVSRYLNQQFDSMTAETKQRVAAAIAELEYTPNMVARGLKVKGMQTIGVIVANVLNPYSTEITRGIEDYCISKGFNMVLCNADDRPEKQQDYIRMLHAK